MQRILAIEADPKRARLLAALLREHVEAEVVLVESVKAAIETLDRIVPDVVLAPTLLAPRDETQLMAHVNRLASHVQTVTVPALDLLDEPPERKRTGLGRFIRRTRPGLPYDPGMVAAQIGDALERAGTIRIEKEAALDHAKWLAANVVVSGDAGVRSETATRSVLAARQPARERRRARRNRAQEVSWLSHIRTPWGADLSLVNISSGGLLVESAAKLTPGVSYDLQLVGADGTRSIKARIVRSDVEAIDARGVKYMAAAEFDRKVDLPGQWREPVRRAAATPQQALADLLAEVLGDRDRVEPARFRFAQGLRKLVHARDVLVRKAPIKPADGSESIYFQVKGTGTSRAILQVLFDPDRKLTAAEFTVLKAAASLTAAVLEFEKPNPTLAA